MPRLRCFHRARSLTACAGLSFALLSACSPSPPTQEPRRVGAMGTAPVAVVAGDNMPEVPPDPREKVITEISEVLLSERHLLRRPIDDALSRESFPKYIEQLDGAKLLLL